jgi:hypothetical protein
MAGWLYSFLHGLQIDCAKIKRAFFLKWTGLSLLFLLLLSVRHHNLPTTTTTTTTTIQYNIINKIRTATITTTTCRDLLACHRGQSLAPMNNTSDPIHIAHFHHHPR